MFEKGLSVIIGFGIFLWLVSLVLAIRLACLGRENGLTSRVRAWLWLALGLAALALLFRPHEDIFGGEDPGSYLNSGITYGRQQEFFVIDPLLVQVPPEIRPEFYYGHSGYGTTKDACLWVRDPDRAVTGPHFQPAYPLLIALVSRIADPAWALYVIPVFTLFLALALRALASLLLPYRLAGSIAFLVFLLNPLTLWHGRCSRPEIIAGFMFFGGCALLLNAWQHRRWVRWPDLALGALAVSLAPFFHITAGFLLIPAAVMAAIVILRGRDDFLVYPVIALAGGVLFTWQMHHVTDYYGLGRFLNPLIFRPWLAYGLFTAGFIVLALGCGWSRRVLTGREAADQDHPPSSASLFWSLGFAVVSALFIIYISFTRDAAGSLPLLGRPVEHYLYLVDFKTFANMVSMPIALLTLLGWIVWLTGPAEHRKKRVALALVVFPAILFSGNIHDFMMTRYWFTALVPMVALSLTALAVRLGARIRTPWTAVIVATFIILLGFHHRAQMVAVTEYRGLTGFLKPYAETIKNDNGILLCEYSRLAAPLEHIFGIPALGLDNERKSDYSQAEKAWEAIMDTYPDHPAFFMTPFHAPVSDRFDFHEVLEGEFQGKTLLQARQGLPTRIGKYTLRLRLYRMVIKPSNRTYPYTSSSEHYRLNGGNMGMRHFANTRTESATFDTLASSPTQAVIVASLPHPAGNSVILTVALTNPPFLELSDVTLSSLELPPDAHMPPATIHPLKVGFAARWARTRAAVLVPDGFPGGYLIVMATTPLLDDEKKMRINVSSGADELAVLTPEPNRWQWHLVPLPASTAGQWLTLASEPAWNPKLAGFPEDLGILAGHLAFWPAIQEK